MPGQACFNGRYRGKNCTNTRQAAPKCASAARPTNFIRPRATISRRARTSPPRAPAQRTAAIGPPRKDNRKPHHASKLFQDILTTLPAVDDIHAIVLLDAKGEPVGRLDNQPGSAGSVRVYHALISATATSTARPRAKAWNCTPNTRRTRAPIRASINIDRLLSIAEADAPGPRAWC